MNRRGFIGALLGTAAATALPSEVWPFRKFFLPTAATEVILWDKPIPDLTGMGIGMSSPGEWLGLSRSKYPGRLSVPLTATAAMMEADEARRIIEREAIINLQFKQFAKEIPELFYRENLLYKYLKSERTIVMTDVDPVKRVITCSPRKDLLHAKATPENIMEFIDDLEK